MRQEKDRCGKWLIDHHGDAILKWAQITGFTAWRPAQTELVAPRRLPDGLLEVTFSDRPTPDPFIIEIETYADRGVAPQIFEDILITRIERGVIPDVIALILRPKGQIQVESRIDEESRHGLATLDASWRVVELWNLNADDLLAANDVGLIPWVPLTRFSEPPRHILRQCRDRIDAQAKPEEHDALLTVSALLTAVVFNDEALLNVFGGLTTMIESPLLDRIEAIVAQRTTHKNIITSLRVRFGSVPADLKERIQAVDDSTRLEELVGFATICSDIEAFRFRLIER